MTSRDPRRILAAMLIALLVGGGLMSVTPAGAEVASAAATNWKKIWKKQLAPLADKRYYKKAASDAKYSTKTETSTALSGFYTKAQSDAAYALKAQTYTKTESDAAYAPKAQSYTKAESDAKYAPAQPLYRGSMLFFDDAAAAGSGVSESFSFGATFPTAPTPHYIAPGAAVPAGCSGTAAAPNAAAGHLCVFASNKFNTGVVDICSGATATCGAADAFGASIYTYSAAAGQFGIYASWAARPSGPVVNPSFAPAVKGATNIAAQPRGSAPGAD